MINEGKLSPGAIARKLIEKDMNILPITKQAELLSIARSSVYYQPRTVGPVTLDLMNRIDRIHTDWPVYGARKIAAQLKRDTGLQIGRKRAGSIMEAMAIEAIYPRPHLSANNKPHPIYPYLLSNIKIVRPNQVWGSDITYIRMHGGFLYLVAYLDWYSRYVLAFRLSMNLETGFVLSAAADALRSAIPEIINVDQGVQFTSDDFTGLWNPESTRISMDHRGRCFDNIFTERLWRTFKYEEVYLKDYATFNEAEQSIAAYLQKYNYERLHQSLNYKTPAEIYFNKNQHYES